MSSSGPMHQYGQISGSWADSLENRAVDQVKRGTAFKRKHPEVNLTYPRENGTGQFVASWENPPGPQDKGTVETHGHESLRCLLDYLEARFDRGDLRESS